MSTPYQNEFILDKAAAPAETFAVDFPGRCELTRIALLEEGGAAIDADIFNRQLIGAVNAVSTITDDGTGQALITLSLGSLFSPTEVKVGDLLTVAGATVGGYNVATHRVLAISEDRRQAVTSEPYTADSEDGSVQMVLTAVEALFRVMPNIAGASPQVSFPPATGDSIIFVNADPLPNINIGINRKLYIRINGGLGTYRLGLSAILGVAGEG
jgi:hypothetical protein